MAHPCGLQFFTCRGVEGGSGMTGDVLMLVTSDHYRKYSTFRTICAFIWISFKVISPKHRHSALTLSSRGRQCGWCTVNWRSNYEEPVIGGYFCGVSLWLCCYCFKNFVVEFCVCGKSCKNKHWKNTTISAYHVSTSYRTFELGG
jgi:transposase-like protein